MTPDELDHFLNRLEAGLDARIAQRLAQMPPAPVRSRIARRAMLTGVAALSALAILLGAGVAGGSSHDGPVFEGERPVIILDPAPPQRPVPPESPLPPERPRAPDAPAQRTRRVLP